MSDYHCKECGVPVVVTKNGKTIRLCKHTGTIIAGMSAVTKGLGIMKNGKQA